MTRISKRTALAGIAFVAGTLGWTSPASAQAPRTWVSSFGDDANPCSRTAPCKTFAGAISKTAAGGEINCVDPGSYGAVTITKSMSIVCQYVEAGVLSTFGSSGMIINVAATDVVYLRGIDYNGANGANPGFHGIRVVGAGIVATGTNARARVRESTITAWVTGVTQAAGAIINTYGNNSTDGNGAPGAFTLPALPES